MKNIKTSEHVTHHCRLHRSGALNHKCKTQCNGCKNDKATISPHNQRRSELLV